MVAEFRSIDVRPYELMHIVSEIGRNGGEGIQDPRLGEILRSVRWDPATPLTLRCNVTGGYRFQNPGRELDTSEGDLFNLRRDLRILQRMGLVPGSTRPAIEVFRRLLDNIDSGRDILWFDSATSDEWRVRVSEPGVR